jgi:RNA polymerase sigma-70 factor (ECF subfamily)
MRRLGVPGSEVEDLIQEVFLVVFRRWEDFDRTRSLRAWLFGIAFRVASSQRKRRAREIPYASLEPESRFPEPEQELQSKQARALVLEALQRVPLPRRAVFVMHDIDRVAMREIADTLAIPLFTAYSRLRKARAEFESAVKELEEKRHQ